MAGIHAEDRSAISRGGLDRSSLANRFESYSGRSGISGTLQRSSGVLLVAKRAMGLCQCLVGLLEEGG
jgi:hypothetical protein